VLLLIASIALLVRLVVPNVFLFIVTPLYTVSDGVAGTGHALFAGFANTAELALKNEKLGQENSALASENNALRQKIANFSAVLGESGASGIMAEVVARPPQSPYDTLVLAQGSRAGVTKGMEVFGAGHVPIGIITTVSSDYSRAVLFSAPSVSTAGWVGKNSVAVTLTGAGGGAMRATLSRSAGIVEGDTVFVPGPGMLPVGRVERVDGDPSSPSVTLRIAPTLNLFSVSVVELRETGATFTTSPTSTSTSL